MVRLALQRAAFRGASSFRSPPRFSSAGAPNSAREESRRAARATPATRRLQRATLRSDPEPRDSRSKSRRVPLHRPHALRGFRGVPEAAASPENLARRSCLAKSHRAARARGLRPPDTTTQQPAASRGAFAPTVRIALDGPPWPALSAHTRNAASTAGRTRTWCAWRRAARSCGPATGLGRRAQRPPRPPAGEQLSGCVTRCAKARCASWARRTKQRSGGRPFAGPFVPAARSRLKSRHLQCHLPHAQRLQMAVSERDATGAR